MAIASGLNVHVYNKGNIVDPIITLANSGDTDEQATITLFDIYGNIAVGPVTRTVPAHSYATEEYGDVLSAQQLNEGFYIIEVKGENSPAVYHPLVITDTSITDLEIIAGEIPESAKIHTVLVQDRKTGLIVVLPPDPQQPVPYTNRFNIIVYVYDYKTKKGSIWYRIGLSEWQHTKFAKKAIVQYTFKFNSIERMAMFLVAHARGNITIQKTLADLYAKRKYADLARLAQLFFVEPAALSLGRLLDYKVDFENLEITVRSLVTLGFGWDSVKRYALYTAAGAIIGAGIVGGLALTIGTGGTAAIAGGAIVGASLGLAYSILKSDGEIEGGGAGSSKILPDAEDYGKPVKETAEQGKQNLKQVYQDYNSKVNELEQQGQITPQAAEELRQLGYELYITGISAIEDTEKECEQQLKNCVSDYKSRLVVAVLGSGGLGLGVGSALAKRGK